MERVARRHDSFPFGVRGRRHIHLLSHRSSNLGRISPAAEGFGAPGSPVPAEPKNYSVTPPAGYTGKWLVCWTNSSRIWIKANYVGGVKEGVEFRWYRDSGRRMSLHTFSNGILEGKALKYSDYESGPGSTLHSAGIFKSGQPWDGTFLEVWNGAFTNLDVEDKNTLYSVDRYRNGTFITRFWKP